MKLIAKYFVCLKQVETLSSNETVKIPVAVLKVGESRVVQPELEFPYGPVTFTLVEGNGPVYIHGQQGEQQFILAASHFLRVIFD